MKILLVDNGTIHLQKIIDSFSGHEVEVVKYAPEVYFNDADKDLIVLSGGGGEGHEIDDKHTNDELFYDDQIKFVLKTKKPIIGICMGFEVIAAAFGARSEYVNAYFEQFKPVHLLESGIKLLGQKELSQYEAHHMGIRQLSHPLAALAFSANGIEIIKHKTRPILGTQFHPEVPGGTLNLSKITNALLPIVN
jgi:anthranilate/para-aminobenzoate synthase component II